ncbi:MAG TPA: APC family permease [Candidatus Wallbacteria bacterium]|nr:APC family permease [Candidatus Wallbacteria bacterium]
MKPLHENKLGQKKNIFQKLKSLIIGDALDPHDPHVFHNISLIAFFAWVGLGADGLSSSCYGPDEALQALNGHYHLGIFVGLAAAITVFIISSSYSQIIELFPTGGGGYLVASKLLSPTWGMISGCALLVDYVLTITVSIASGADAIFSFLPAKYLPYKLEVAVLGLVILTLLNLRGVKESVMALLPIFLVFVATHVFVILYAVGINIMSLGTVVTQTVADVHKTSAELGFWGMMLLILRAYTMGAGTYTGIEAVSNGLPILREPKVETGKRTMVYMSVSLAFTVFGLMLAYLLLKVSPVTGKTMNAVLLDNMTVSWPKMLGLAFIYITLISEAALLFVAAQAGFLDGPRVLANMALDRWFPNKFAMLSDRLVNQNGILIMGISALMVMLYTHGQVSFLIVLYSINVFVTFMLSQLGMVKHWWLVRNEEPKWKHKLLINGIGLVITSFILVSVTVIKFHEGGWLTILITGSLVALAISIKRHYNDTSRMIGQLQTLLKAADITLIEYDKAVAENRLPVHKCDPGAKTAVLLVGGYNGMGLHALFNIIKIFGDTFKNYVFLRVGVVDAGNFKGVAEIDKLKEHAQNEVDKYVKLMTQHGYYAEGISAIGTDVVDETMNMSDVLTKKYSNAIFFGGQLIFPEASYLAGMLHNYTAFVIQRKFYYKGIPIVILPIRLVEETAKKTLRA